MAMATTNSSKKFPKNNTTKFVYSGNLSTKTRVPPSVDSSLAASSSIPTNGKEGRQEAVINKEVMRKIAKILSVSPALMNKLEVTSSYSYPSSFVSSSSVTSEGRRDLYMVNAKETPNGELDHIRGRVIDLQSERQIARAFGNSPNIETVGINKAEDGSISLIDGNGQAISLHGKTSLQDGMYQLQYGFEGVLLMVYLAPPSSMVSASTNHGGRDHPVTTNSGNREMMVSTHRNLFAENAKWAGRGKFFGQYWNDYAAKAGLTKEKLFGGVNEGKEVCLLFMAVVPELMTASKIPFRMMNRPEGFLSYLGNIPAPPVGDAGSPTGASASVAEAGKTIPCTPPVEEYKEQFSFTSKLFLNPEEMNHPDYQIYFSHPITVDQANSYLHYGFYQVNPGSEGYISQIPPQFVPGESVILSEFKLENGSPVMIRSHRLCSPSYTWRKEVMGDDSNLFHRYFVNQRSDLPQTKNIPAYPSLAYLQIHALEDQCLSYIPMRDPMTQKEFPPLISPADRMYYAMLIAAPPFHYAEILGFQAKSQEVKTVVTQFIKNLVTTKCEIELKEERTIGMVAGLSSAYPWYADAKGHDDDKKELDKRIAKAMDLHTDQQIYHMWREYQRVQKFLAMTPKA